MEQLIIIFSPSTNSGTVQLKQCVPGLCELIGIEEKNNILLFFSAVLLDLRNGITSWGKGLLSFHVTKAGMLDCKSM